MLCKKNRFCGIILYQREILANEEIKRIKNKLKNQSRF
jgi:hypothetical protein